MVSLISQQKMDKNLIRAIDERARRRDPALMNIEEYSRFGEVKPITCTMIDQFKNQGNRYSMEDVSFVSKIGENVLLGIFDGHGSRRASDFASRVFQQNFLKVLTSCDGSVHEAFMRLFPAVQNAFIRSGIGTGGTTALVMYLDTKEQKVYTATLGDSEAYLYRKIDQKFKALPLSCVRTWGSPKDAKRLTDAMGRPDLMQEYINMENPKSIRYCISKGKTVSGLNVARAIGDIEFLYWNCKPVVIQKPKITQADYRAGDLIVLASDGLWDFIRQKEVILEIEALKPQDKLSSRIGKRSMTKSTDNVSVIGVQFIPCPLCS